MIFSGISVRMPVCKGCPSCDCEVHVRILDCLSYGLVLRQRKAKPLVEDLAKRRTLKRVCAARQIAVETVDQADDHRRHNRACTARKTALETADQTDKRRRRNRDCVARKKAVETAEKADKRRKCNRVCATIKS